MIRCAGCGRRAGSSGLCASCGKLLVEALIDICVKKTLAKLKKS